MAIKGTYSVSDLLAAGSTASVVDFGIDRVFDAIQDSLNAHNNIVRSLIASFVNFTTDRLRRYGGLDVKRMEQLDEYGTPRPQKISGGATVGFPMKLFGVGSQWTDLWFENHTPAEMAGDLKANQEADLHQIMVDIKKALYLATNKTFVDQLVDNVSLPVKAFINADSAPIPVGPNGETFDAATHTHYTADAALSTAVLSAAITNVTEHYGEGDIELAIAKADEAAVRALTGFVPYVDARTLVGDDTLRARGRSLDLVNTGNRAIGLYDGAEVWVRPWAIAGYYHVRNRAAAKPLAYRTRGSRQGDRGLRILYQGQVHPLNAIGYGREYGIGVWDRRACAVLYVGGGSYVEPTIT